MKTLSKTNIDFINQKIDQPELNKEVQYYSWDWLEDSQKMIINYIRNIYNEEISDITLSTEYLYNCDGCFEFAMPYLAIAMTIDDHREYRRVIEIQITHIRDMIILNSTSEIERYNSRVIELPFDLDYGEALEFVLSYPSVLQN